MNDKSEFKIARFVPQSGDEKNQEILVHFNPLTLQYTVTNTMSSGQGNRTKQYVSQSTAKLTMDLVFDTTTTGEDVRTYTEKIANFMKPGKGQIPPIVLFEWGTYKFQGMAESYRETLDFFAPSGVPLRSSINLSLARQDDVFAPSEKGSFANVSQGDLAAEPLEMPGSPVNDVTSLATRAGDPRAARGIAESNNLSSLRASGGESISISESITLGGPVAFSRGANFNGQAGLDRSGTGSSGVGVSFGGSASAGISASAGAFDGLRIPPLQASSIQLDLKALIPRQDVAKLPTDSGATFQVGGKAIMQSSSSLKANVGAQADPGAQLHFED